MHNSVVLRFIIGKLHADSMRKTFVSNLILLLSLNLLVKPAYLLLVEAEIQNRAGAAAFGNYFALINFSFLLNIIPDMGITNWNTTNIARYSHLVHRYFPAVLSLRLLLAGVYFVVVLICAFALRYSPEQLAVLSLLAFNQVLASLILYLRSNLTALHRFAEDSIISVLDRSVLMILMGILLWGGIVTDGSFKVEWLVWGQTVAYSITVVVAMTMVLKNSHFGKIKFSKPVSLAIVRQSVPYALLIFTSMIAYRADSVMLERMRSDGAHEAGIYAMGFRFYEAYNMIAYLFAVLLLPIFSRMLKQKLNVSGILSLAFKILFVGSWTVSLACYFFSGDILGLFYDHDIEAATPVFSWLMIGCLAFSLQYVFGTLLTAGGYLRALITIAIVAVIINVTLNLFLIPLLGARGSAIANGICQLMVLAAQGIVVIKKLNIRPIPGLIFRTGLFMAGTTIIGFWCTINDYPLAYSLLLVTAGALIFAILTRMLDIRNFVRLLNEST